MDGVEFEDYIDLQIIKKLNQIRTLSIELFDLSATQLTACVKNKDIYIFHDLTLVFKGQTRKIENIEDGNSKVVKASGKEIILMDRINYDSSVTDGRKEWSNTAGETIIAALVSGIISTGTLDSMDSIGFRAEYDTVLGAVSGIAKVCGKDWYVDQTSEIGTMTSNPTETIIYDTGKAWGVNSLVGYLVMVTDGVGIYKCGKITSNTATSLTCTNTTFLTDGVLSGDTYKIYKVDQLNVTTEGNASVSQQTFVLGDDTINSEPADDLNDIFNVIHVLGYGDGINQIRGKAFHATDNRAVLSAAINATTTTANVVDGSLLPASGNVWIGREYCAFTKSVNVLTITRGTEDLNAGKLDAYAHSAGIEVVDAQYTASSEEAGSSIDTNGIMENRYQDRSIIDQNTIDFLAQRLLEKYKDTGITGEFEYTDTITTAVLGDKITITDYETNDTTYRLVGWEYDDNMGSVFVVYQTPGTYTGQLQELEKDMDINNPYGQGATNIWQITHGKNVDNNVPLTMKVFIPSDAIIINSIKISYNVTDFEKYTGVTAGGSAHTHDIDIDAISGGNDIGWIGVQTIGSENKFVAGQNVSNIKSNNTEASHTHNVNANLSTAAADCNDIAISVDSVDKTAALEAIYGTLSISADQDLEIKDYLSSPQAGAWHTIVVTPNGVGSPAGMCFITAHITAQVFIKSN